MFAQFQKSVMKGVTYALIGIVAVWMYNSFVSTASAFPDVPATRYQAVFFGTGQVYFGKLTDLDANYVMLSDVYYLKEASELSQSNLNLVKLGGELHGPDNVMYIRKESISYWENMKDTSRVVQTIAGSKQ